MTEFWAFVLKLFNLYNPPIIQYINIMSSFTLDPTNYQMKGNPPKSSVAAIAPTERPDLSRLDDMTREELITLIKIVGGAIWGYALDDNEQKAEAARLKLYNMGMSATEVHKVVPALDKWFDRTQGKAPQSISMDARMVAHVSLTQDERRANAHKTAIDMMQAAALRIGTTNGMLVDKIGVTTNTTSSNNK